MKKDLLWTDAKDIWYVNVGLFWSDFEGTPSNGGRAIPFIETFPLTMWMYSNESDIPTGSQSAKMHLLVSFEIK